MKTQIQVEVRSPGVVSLPLEGSSSPEWRDGGHSFVRTVAHLNSPRAPLSLGPGLRLARSGSFYFEPLWQRFLLLSVLVGGIFHLEHGALVRVDQKHVKSFFLSFFYASMQYVGSDVPALAEVLQL